MNTASIDFVSVLKKYTEKYSILANKWHLVTGERMEIYNLGTNQYFVENELGAPKHNNDFLHTENFLLIDTQKHILGIYNGLNNAFMAQLVTDIKSLKSKSLALLSGLLLP